MAHNYHITLIDVTSREDLSANVEKKLERVRSKIKHQKSHQNLPMLHKLASYESMDSSLFQPRYCSYGPYHMPKVQDNKVKWLCLAMFLDNFSDNIDLGVVLEKLQSLEEKARHCYEDVTLSSDEFVEMLLLDSCSILFFLMPKKDDELPEIQNLRNLLFPDMLLIENQIPFFVIEAVWGYFAEVASARDVFKETVLINLFKHTPFWGDNSSKDIAVEDPKIDHLIHLYYLWNVPRVETNKPYRTPRSLQTSVMPSATELYEAGIKFKPKMNYSDMFDISFENGILEIPTLVVTPKCMSLIANLAVFEVHSIGKYAEQRRVVSYVILMDSLINTEKDVAILQKFGVVDNRLQSNQDFASFINGLGERFTNVSNNFFTPLIGLMMVYYGSCCRKNLTSLKHNYCSSPWMGISVFAGTLLLCLSFLQTYFTIFPRGK